MLALVQHLEQRRHLVVAGEHDQSTSHDQERRRRRQPDAHACAPAVLRIAQKNFAERIPDRHHADPWHDRVENRDGDAPEGDPATRIDELTEPGQLLRERAGE